MQYTVREPVAAGRFYPKEQRELIDQLDRLGASMNLLPTIAGRRIIGGIVPHAGYIYSGKHALSFIKELKALDYDTVVILSPGHTGIGPPLSIDSHSHWKTPLGLIQSDTEMINAGIFQKDNSAQEFEHAAEVILPLLQYFCPQLMQIAVITIRNQDFPTAVMVANNLKYYIEKTNQRLLVIASSDFNHFEPAKTGRQKDDNVLNKILTFDVEGVEKAVRKYNVSVCGVGPIMALLHYTKNDVNEIGCRILSRGHSGEVNNSDSVVNYISMIFYTR